MTNKFKYILAVLCVFASTGLFAQQNWQWGHRVEDETYGATTDSHGNTYMGWVIDGSIPGIPHVYPLEGGHNISNDSGQCVLTSYTCNGTYRWSKVFGVPGGGGSCIVTAYGTDSLGGVYVFGSMGSSNGNLIFHIGDTTMPTTYEAAFIAKFDTLGHYKWIRVFIDTSFTDLLYTECLHADIMPNGNSYFVMLLPTGIYDNGAFTATYPTGNNLYSLEYDRNGNFIKAVHLDIHYAVNGAQFQSTRFVRSPSTGDYYLSGGVGGNSMFQLGDSVLPGGPTTEFVAKFDSSFNLLWVTEEQGTTHVPEFKGPSAVDSAGNVYVTGGSGPGRSFGPFTFYTNQSPYQIPILVKLSPTGTVLNATNADESEGATWANAVAFTNGIIGVSGSSGSLQWGNLSISYNSNNSNGGIGNFFLARFNAANLNIIGLDSIKVSGFGGSFPPTADDLSADSKGDFYMGGSFPAALYLPNDTLYNQSPEINGYVAKFGFANCNCNPPASNFTHGNPVVNTAVSFTYSGATPVDSVLWDFGDGSSATGTNVSHSYTQSANYTVCAVSYNSCGSNMHCERLNVPTTGIGEIPGFAQVVVYPNPATQTLHISHAPAGTELDIDNMVGVRVLHTVLQGNKNEVSVGGLAPGVYILQFTDQNGRRGMTKFVKE